MTDLLRRRVRVVALCALVATLVTAYAGSLLARPASAAGTSTAGPLAGPVWGIDTTDPLALDWATRTGTERSLLGKIERQSRVRWFTPGLATGNVGTVIGRYVATVQDGDPDRLVPMALFRIFPRGEAHRNVALTPGERSDYLAWMTAAASAIGSARAVVVLEPDLAEVAPPNRAGVPVVPDAAVREALVSRAAQMLSALPNTTVYLDAGDADWLPVSKATALLIGSGVAFTRGFALGATHYSPVGSDVSYAAALEASLAAAGPQYAGKKAVLDTADNGRGFTWGYWHAHRTRLGSDFDNAAVCRTRSSTHCVTLGHAPTWDVAAGSAPYLDAYLWFGRPWLTRQASPYNRTRALQAARTTPYSMLNLTS